MQSFGTFQTVFAFLIRSMLDKLYVEQLDNAVEQGTASDDEASLISNVRSFHRMRQTLCARVFRYFQNDGVLQDLWRARGLVQYNSVPEGALCSMTSKPLLKAQGCMFILNPSGDMTPVVVHKRFKLLLYNFWYLVHFTEEIMLDVRAWVSKQAWWTRGYNMNYENIVERVIGHGNGSFVKKHYVKLKDASQHIQNAVAHGPINQTDSSNACHGK